MKRDPYAPLRDQMAEAPTHWRSVEHKDNDTSVAKVVDVEFPNGLADASKMDRRELLKLAGTSAMAVGLASCVRRPEEEILPYTKQPVEVTPGVPSYYATAMARPEGAVGLLVEAHEGRPTKIEGNPQHPASLGASDIWAQAEIMRLYDPDRARKPLQGGKPSTWEAWDAFAKELVTKSAANGGAGVALLLDEDDSPTFERMLAAFRVMMPQAAVHRYDPLAPDHQLRAAELAFGPGARVRYDLSATKVLFALDSDFLVRGPEHIRLAREFGKARAVLSANELAKMNRLYVAEGVFSTTGGNADHRLRLPSGQAGALLRAVAGELASKHGVAALATLAGDAQAPSGSQPFVAALAKDLAKHRGGALVLVGERQPVAVHALGYAINAALGALESKAMAVVRRPNATPREGGLSSLQALTASLNAGKVETLIVFGSANPAHTAPGAMKFAEAMAKAGTVVHVGLLADETAQKAAWHLPTAHFLETWGDATAWDGTASIVQPLILPLFGSRAPASVLAQLARYAELSDRKLVEETWRGAGGALADGKAWRRALHDGVVPNTAWTAETPTVNAEAVSAEWAKLAAPAEPSVQALELVAMEGHVLDGRLANVTWLQELPDSMSKLCWDNALLVSPALAKELGIESRVRKNAYTSDLVELQADGRSVTLPTFVLPGLATYTVAVNQGYGRSAGGVASGVGVAVTPLLGDGTVLQGVKLTRTGKTTQLCSTQDHFSVPANPFKEMTFAQMVSAQGKERTLGLGERPLYRTGDAEEYREKGATFAREGDVPAAMLSHREEGSVGPAEPVQMTDAVAYEGQQWGMAIDLSSCIGCNACMVACQSENNIPTVGREQVMLGRELHWIRVDRYFSGDVEEPRAAHQPVPCMHCENAPCEPVCPVGATTHDEEGINSMAYNRCIGTRYCNNNCPYKVRRYNYLDFSKSGDIKVDETSEERWKVMQLQRNPDVTVRYRGVMEKCTYCTQRIESAKIAHKRKGGDRKALPDGAVTPACAQTCPTQAITFGNIHLKDSKVAQVKASDRNYEMLQELNVRPRTTYLARLRNKNEELE